MIPRLGKVSFALVVVVLAAPCSGALNYNDNAIKGLFKAYGFILGQEYSLGRIEATYPDLRMRVKLARYEFASTFSGIKEKLEAELQTAIGSASFAKLRTQMEVGTRDLLEQQPMTPAVAQQFIVQVRARAKGDEVEGDVLNYLLAVQYAKRPGAEFGDGFRQRFRTDGTGKSQGVRLNLQLPRSWVGADGDRPHIVRKWSSEGGTGLSYVMLQVRDAQGYNPTAREIEEFVRSGEARETFVDLGKVHDIGLFSVERRPGYWTELSMNQERAGIAIYLRGFMYQFFYRGKGISVMCMAGAKVGENQSADAKALLIKPVCQQVINSVVLEQAY